LQKQCASEQQKASHYDVINARKNGILKNKVAFKNTISLNKYLIFITLSVFEEALNTSIQFTVAKETK